MQTETERTLNNLNILAALSQNDKLLTNDDVFDIHSPTTMRALWRFWYREGRGGNVQRVRTCIRCAINFISNSLEEANELAISLQDTDQRSIRLKFETTTMHHLRMLCALKNARNGIQNLLQTYRDDPALQSQVALLKDEIDDFVRLIEPHSSSLRGHFSSPVETTETRRRTLQ